MLKQKIKKNYQLHFNNFKKRSIKLKNFNNNKLIQANKTLNWRTKSSKIQKLFKNKIFKLQIKNQK